MLILLLLLSQVAHADDYQNAVHKGMMDNVCIDGGQLAFSYNYKIIKKLNKNHYEIVGHNSMMKLHAILETTKSEFKGTGAPMGIKMKHVGTKTAELENGFETTVDMWKECS